MKSFRIRFVLLLVVAALAAPVFWYISAGPDDSDPDLPPGKTDINKDEYRRLRDEYFGLLRGMDTMQQDSRGRAVREMEGAEQALRSEQEFAPMAPWRALGPAPIPNGQTVGRSDPVSGRTVSIAIHPTNPDIVYAGTAQGGLYRTLNGGTTWVPLLDSALSLAAGSVAIAPSDPSIVYVGTGESSLSSDSFFGAGVYRINNADSPNPVVSGPFTRDALNADVLTGRGTGRILVHPTDPNTIFVATVSGAAGFGSTAGGTFPPRGLYRSTNAGSASPVFERLVVSGAGTDRPMMDAIMEPGNPNRMFVVLVDNPALGDGGIYFTANALDPVPTFTRVLVTGSGDNNLGRAELAIQKTGDTVTVYAGVGTGTGQVHKATYDSTSPGTPAFAMTVDNNFCNPQCFYDQAIAVDPNDPNRVYLGGSPTLPFGISTNGGTSFTSSSTGLHVDSHTIAVSPSNPSTIFFGSDGGVWKSIDSGATWVSQNNSTFSATQFESVAVHPRDRHYTLGGTQDNGTEYLFPDGLTWTRSVGGDGGPALIDSNSTSPTSLVAYHTFFNSTNSQIGFQRSTTQQANGNPQWSALLGCGGTANGIACTDRTLFYAPMVLGPNAPGSTGNTVYFGTEKLYRSINQGTTMIPVSQSMPTTGNERISAIGISPQNDDIRLIGTTLGKVFYSDTAGATTMTEITGTVPARFVARIAIDPTNSNTAYIALNGFGIPNQHVMKTTNLNSPTPTWTNAGVGIPDVPTNGLVIDPENPQTLYAGTDIGVFRSTDGAASWEPFSAGLPRVAVFEIVLQPTRRILKIATHGRGIWEYNLSGRSAPFDFDGDNRTDIGIYRASVGEWWIHRSASGSVFAAQFGDSNDRIAPVDFTGDSKVDVAFWRPSTGEWFILRSENNTYFSAPFGATGDVPVPADYDADAKGDVAVFRPSTGFWFIQRSSDGSVITQQFGTTGDLPIASDYDGDARTDIAIYRPSVGEWWISRSTLGVIAYQFGNASDKLVPGDYTGDLRSDVAFWRPSTGEWFILRSEDTSYFSAPFGASGDIVAPGDYDGDGKFDLTVFRPSAAMWFSQRSTAGTLSVPFGVGTDTPIPSAFVP